MKQEKIVYDSLLVDEKYAVQFSIKRNINPTVIVFLGIGQAGYNFRHVSEYTADCVAIVEALPYQKMNRDKMNDISINAVINIVKKIGKKKLTVVAESQAAPAIVYAAQRAPKLFEQIVLLAPLGLNPQIFGDTKKQHRKILTDRSKAFWREPERSLRDKANRETLREIIKLSLPRIHRINPDLAHAGSQNIIAVTKKVASTLPLAVFAGEHDVHFPYREISPNLTGSNVKLEFVKDGIHLNRATARGMKELNDLIQTLSE